MTEATIIVTCEHGGRRVPAPYAELFRGAARTLASHRGWDPGALSVARVLARRLDARFFYSTVTRLLVDLNRSLHHPKLFSEFAAELDPTERETVLARHYHPYRRAVERTVADATRRNGAVFHLSVHTFTPVLGGEIRRADIGLLYDPSRSLEKRTCRRWQEILGEIDPSLRVRRNYPYRGRSDGFTTFLRRRFERRDYLGIELEINQRFFTKKRTGPALPLVRTLETSLEQLRVSQSRAPAATEPSGCKTSKR
jgi:predicted N-formylglutamate amidohydrolase